MKTMAEITHKAPGRRALFAFHRLWLVVFLVPWQAFGQCCANNVYVDCAYLNGPGFGGNCDGTNGRFIADDENNPGLAPTVVGACIYCTVGCICCYSVQVYAAGVCCGSIENWTWAMCCLGTDCAQQCNDCEPRVD